MNAAKALWASVQNDPVFMQRLHGWATIFWVAIVPISFVYRDALVWVVFMSHYAIITGHWSSWQAARVEVKQEEQAQ